MYEIICLPFLGGQSAYAIAHEQQSISVGVLVLLRHLLPHNAEAFHDAELVLQKVPFYTV